jgi:hypothetical protein
MRISRVSTRLLRATSAMLLAMGLCACTSQAAEPIHVKPKPYDETQVAHPPRIGANNVMDDDEIIRLDRTGCGFVCPSYQLSFFRDGTVRFTGRSHTAVTGVQQERISDADVAELLRDLQEQLPPIAKRYTPDSKDCGQMFTDQPTTKLSARLQQGVVTSERYGGCPNAPKALAALEKRVDGVAQSDRWVSKSPVY